MDEQQIKAKAYQRQKQILSLWNLVWTPLLLLLVFASGISGTLKLWALGISDHFYASVAIYFFFFSVLLWIIDLPLSYYSGYILEHRYGLSAHTLRSWTADLLKRSVLSLLIAVALMLALYAVMKHFEGDWWIYAWAGYALFSYGFGKLFPVFILPLFYRYSPIASESLQKRIYALAAKYGMIVENIYSLNLSRTTKKANAAFMGLGKTKRIVLSDTLLEHFSDEEIESVLAHELGHFKHKDILKQLVLGLAASFLGFWVTFKLMQWAVSAFQFSAATDLAAMPVLFLFLYGFTVFLMPLQNLCSRAMERAADFFALEALQNSRTFISAMQKLGELNLADPRPHPLYEWFFYSHPAIWKRIRMAEEWQRQQ